jgi:4-diphosphocytidyl-2-C-methyl-D-erythritol kinase
MSSVDLDLSAYELKFIFPELHISTSEAYAEITPKISETDLLDLISQPIENWKTKVKNDFEILAFKKHPQLGRMKSQLYTDGAIYASMSGSGSVLYGVFER